MGYLLYTISVLPCLLGGLVLSIRDLVHRRVSRLHVTIIACGQFVWFLVYALLRLIDFSIMPAACAYALVSICWQLLLFRLSRGALGFGDVTSAGVLCLLFAPFGLHNVWMLTLWWLLSGVLAGIGLVLCVGMKKEQNIAYVPAMYIAAVITVFALL
ncbi:hypothetical protein [Alloscardovia criceti]|uniref:hypothetical protein n=1 Tax=Alloscardovia criceti TaxID=356828 RepID=UPI0012E9D8AB|nr:hypothetical protein [Alloscardovia criceti]